MEVFCTTTFSGTRIRNGVKFHKARMPPVKIWSVTCCAVSTGIVMMAIVASYSFCLAFGLDYVWKKGSNLSLKKLWLPLLLTAILVATALVFAKSVIDNLPNAQISYIDLTIAAVTKIGRAHV